MEEKDVESLTEAMEEHAPQYQDFLKSQDA